MGKQKPDWVQKILDDEKEFWKLVYPKKIENEKIKYWASSMYRSMREQRESGLKVYSIYTANWLKYALEKEPKFIELLPQIYKVWGGMFDSGVVDRIIKKHLKNIEKEDKTTK